MATAPKHIGKTARRVKKAADKGELIDLKDRKALRSGQRAKGRKKKAPRIETSFVESTELVALGATIIGTDSMRLRSLAQARILYLFSSAERVSGEDIGHVGRYPRKFTFRPNLKYDFVVTIARPIWERSTDEDKTRILYHFLRHCGTDTSGRYVIEDHDFEGFYSELEMFGQRDPKIRKAIEQLALFEHVGQVTKPEEGGKS